jgi:hypothetical protein
MITKTIQFMIQPYSVLTGRAPTQSVKFMIMKVTLQIINSLNISILFFKKLPRDLLVPIYIRINIFKNKAHMI